MKNAGILILMALVFAGCNEDYQPQNCSTPATVRDLTGLDGCGWVFELQDGTRLEPIRIFRCGTPPISKEMTEDPLYNFEFVDYKKVLIDYELVENTASVCMTGPLVRITCLTEARVMAED
ncbi:MAG TPA: hypothetical protein VFU05_20920 [Cyclobacteriaceae bacterium]|nr:hypothetical protein [Cyclobacteriaceae bacterium]